MSRERQGCDSIVCTVILKDVKVWYLMFPCLVSDTVGTKQGHGASVCKMGLGRVFMICHETVRQRKINRRVLTLHHVLYIKKPQNTF